MAYTRRRTTLVTTSADVSASLGLGAVYARPLGMRVALTGTDTAVQLELKDADGRIFYKDAADRDYKTAAKDVIFTFDDTATGLSVQVLDATGAAAAANEVGQGVVVKSPINVRVINGGTTTDSVQVDLYCEV